MRTLNADNRLKQKQQPAVTIAVAHVVSTSTASSYTSSGVLLCLITDAVRSVVARPTLSRELRKTGGAMSEVEGQQRQSATAGSPFRTGEQLALTPSQS